MIFQVEGMNIGIIYLQRDTPEKTFPKNRTFFGDCVILTIFFIRKPLDDGHFCGILIFDYETFSFLIENNYRLCYIY